MIRLERGVTACSLVAGPQDRSDPARQLRLCIKRSLIKRSAAPTDPTVTELREHHHVAAGKLAVTALAHAHSEAHGWLMHDTLGWTFISSMISSKRGWAARSIVFGSKARNLL